MSEFGGVRKRSDIHDDDDKTMMMMMMMMMMMDSRRTNISRVDGNDALAEEITSKNLCDLFGK